MEFLWGLGGSHQEVEWIDDDVRSLAVHEAARILELAGGPDEIFLSSTNKKDLTGDRT